MNKPGRNGGFTLIELLVVISIILILIALLFPALSIVEERANKTKCLSNCRQIAVAAQTLMGELGETMPFRNGEMEWGQGADTLLPYVKNIEGVFDCPANPGNQKYSNCRMASGNYTDYELNGYLCSTPGYPSRKQGMLSDLSKAAYAYDYPYGWSADFRAHGGKFSMSDAGYLQRRDDGINCAYLDGHAAWLPDAEMGDLNLTGDATMKSWPDSDPRKHFYLKGHVMP